MTADIPTSHKTLPALQSEVFIIASAGFESTASVLRLIIFHIFSDRKILNQLRHEISSALGTSDSPNLKSIEQLPYLTAVIMEGLRLSPGLATRLARVSDKELIYKNWKIPAGVPVSMTTLHMHMDESIYPDPSHFNPERWMELEARKTLEKTFAPFSRGTRICLGIR